jgi:hypothetical protein
MSHSLEKRGAITRVREFAQLVRSLLDYGHDFEAIGIASTILDRSVRVPRGDSLCGIDEFLAAGRILKDIEGPDGAALDGGGPEPDLETKSRRFGTFGLESRRKAFAGAAQTLEHLAAWKSPWRKFFAQDSDLSWRWQPSGWFPIPLGDVGAMISQPLVVVLAPSRAMLLRAGAILRELCAPDFDFSEAEEPLLRRSLQRPQCPYLGAVLLDTAETNPAELMRALREVIALRTELREAGWKAAQVHVVALGVDPVAACLGEWLRRDRAVDDFPGVWREVETSAELGRIFQASTQPVGMAGVLRDLCGQEMDALAADCESAGGVASKNLGVTSVTFARFENLHRIAETLWRESGAEDPIGEVMDRARLAPEDPVEGRISAAEGLELDGASLANAYAAPLMQAFYSETERATLVEKWSASAAEESGIVYVFPHIPKTAGSSVHYHLKTNLVCEREYIHIPIDYSTRAELLGELPFTLRDARERAAAKVIFGHGVVRRHAEFVPGKTLREITTLRDPAERMVSHYNFWMNVLEKRGEPLPSFEEWYAGEPRNYQTHWLARNYLQLDVETLPESRILDEVSRLLDSFWLVCTLPTFESDIQLLWDALGLPAMSSRQNVTGVTHNKRFELDPALRRRLAEENASDETLYQKWLQRNSARKRPALIAESA